MKASLVRTGPFAVVALLTTTVGGDPTPQAPLSFTQGLQGTFNADWEGVAARTYFAQFSTDLETWHYAPFMEFGDGEHSRGIESDSDNFFLRLHYGDFDGINSLDEAMNADFDGDGLINIFEVTHGYDPFNTQSTIDGPDSSLDPDEDGLGNSSEQTASSDPMAKDNPNLKLEVTEE
jgi:hypothetical protein